LLMADAERAQAQVLEKLVGSKLQHQAQQLRSELDLRITKKDAELRYKDEQLRELGAELARLSAVVARHRDGPSANGSEHKILRLKHENDKLTRGVEVATEKVDALEKQLALIRVEPRSYCKPTGYGDRDLLFAVKDGDSEGAKRWLKAGVDPNLERLCGWTCLHYAAYQGDTDLIELLIKHGASAQVQDTYGQSPLAQAVI
jgi:hypothetical protein